MTVIHTCLEYIESHIKEKIALENLADAVGISKYHLHRIAVKGTVLLTKYKL
jgi:methylphosphotriester-DNA--protein-cysteine methyltransferase